MLRLVITMFVLLPESSHADSYEDILKMEKFIACSVIDLSYENMSDLLPSDLSMTCELHIDLPPALHTYHLVSPTQCQSLQLWFMQLVVLGCNE
jgi:hypothetical protein